RASANTCGSRIRQPGRSVSMIFMPDGRSLDAVLSDQADQILPVPVLRQRPGELAQLGVVDPAVEICDFLRAADAQALALFDRLDVGRRLEQRFVRAGVEPGVTTTELFQMQRVAFEVAAIEVGDLQLAAFGWLERRRVSRGRAVVEVEPGHGVMR